MKISRKAKPTVVPARMSPRYTLEEAFNYFNLPDSDDKTGPMESALNNQRAVRSVAFLLHTCSDMGNESIDGMVAHGLAHALEKIASDLACVEDRYKWEASLAAESSQKPKHA